MNRVEQLMNTTKPWLTDGGLETTLIFHEGADLPCFAAFTELHTVEGRARILRYYESYLDTARDTGTGFVLDIPVWRANMGWAGEIGLNADDIRAVNRKATAFMAGLRTMRDSDATPVILNGVIGPAGDGYAPESALSVEDAQALHSVQIDALAEAGVDCLTAVTMTSTAEAIGVTHAAKKVGLPIIVSFTVETDAHLPSGESIGQAIERVDAATGSAPLFYMINCAHPDHFRAALDNGETWLSRIGAIRANASRMSHAELDEAEELDPGDPGELARDYQGLQDLLPGLKILGGCCGTDHRHISAIGHACCHNHRAAA